MKVILLQDVKSVGKKGEVVDVSDGYGQNFLIPRKLASPATAGHVKKASKEAADQSSKKARELEAAKQLAARLSADPIEIRVKVGEGGRLFGSVTSADVVKAVKDSFGEHLEKKNVNLPKPIRELGEHKVKAKLYQGEQAELQIHLLAEEA